MVIKKKDIIRYLFKKPLFFALDINNISVTKPILLVNKKSILNIWGWDLDVNANLCQTKFFKEVLKCFNEQIIIKKQKEVIKKNKK